MMKTIDIKEITALNLKSIYNGNRLVVTHQKKPIFAIVSIKDAIILEGMQLEDLQGSADAFDINEILEKKY